MRGKSAFERIRPEADEIGVERVAGFPPGPPTIQAHKQDYQALLDSLGDENLRQIATWCMEGYTSQEIALRLGRSVSSVNRKLERIRQIWSASRL